MFPGEDLRLLHRSGDEWHEMHPVHDSPAEHDYERELVKGGRVYECTRCDLKFRVTDASGEETV